MSERIHQIRRTIVAAIVLLVVATGIFLNDDLQQPVQDVPRESNSAASGSAANLLETITIKGRAPKTGYDRAQFGDGWGESNGCDVRNIILNRDMRDVAVGDDCLVVSGTLDDPYTGKIIEFVRGPDTSADIQIDHVVALSDAWQKGAQQLTYTERVALANDPLELLAVDGEANQQKSGSDAASWLPPNKSFRCQYVARQIAVKSKYGLWMTQAEHDAIESVLSRCPGQAIVKLEP